MEFLFEKKKTNHNDIKISWSRYTRKNWLKHEWWKISQPVTIEIDYIRIHTRMEIYDLMMALAGTY